MASINTDIAQTLDITCRRGDTLAIDINFKDSTAASSAIDISSGFTFQMQVRNTALETGTPILGDATSGTGSAGSISLTPGASGKLSILITDDVMKDVPGGDYVYDIQAAKDGDGSIQTWVKGSFTVNEDVTIYAST